MACWKGEVGFAAVARLLAVLVLLVCGFMLGPAAVALAGGDGQSGRAFLAPIVVGAALAGAVWWGLRHRRAATLTLKGSFLLVTLSWVVASLLGAVPFWLSGAIPSVTDAVFETVSGFSTTGASILADVEGLPASVLLWRSLTQWLGGMGIVVLAVAVLPLLGVGGVQLLRAEAPGPTVDRLTPRITGTAKILWLMYLGLTVLLTALLWLGGLDLLAAIAHACATMATGGFSTCNASLGHFGSAWVEWVVTVFMLLAGINFVVHYRLLTGRWRDVRRDSELKAYGLVFGLGTALIAADLAMHAVAGWDAVRLAAFQVASLMTTTGFSTADYCAWPGLSQMVLLALMLVGGCAGSTGGGIKVVRWVVLIRVALNHVRRLIHPRGVFALRVRGAVLPPGREAGIVGFFVVYILLVLGVAGVVAAAGEGLETALGASLATVGNIGPGFGHVGPTGHYGALPDLIKWVLAVAMLVGRLEIYTVLVLFSPVFWRR